MADRVLLSIDDDPQILALVREVAEGLGFAVETASSAGTFMTAYVRARPSVITVDICMPETDGIELLRWLGDVGTDARIIILSGAHPSYGEMAQRLALVSGAMNVGILRKPFRLAQLREALSGDIPANEPAAMDPRAGARPAPPAPEFLGTIH